MADRQVTCIIKPDRDSTHEHITHLGGYGWCWPVERVMNALYSGTDTFYTWDGRKRAEVKIRVRNGRRFVQTQTDGDWSNNLLSQETCPLQ